ncbi:MAG: His/Gly/Thr/Pro-type tRNA ligase C-terminal domain-containing protein, partial [Terriglobia bacterium]
APKGSKGTGWALGLDRFLLALEAAKAMPAPPALDVFIAWMGAATYDRARALAGRLRAAGLSTELPYDEVKLRKALERANKLGARYVVLIGEDEVKQDKFTLRDMASGTQRSLQEAQLLGELTGTTDEHR